MVRSIKCGAIALGCVLLGSASGAEQPSNLAIARLTRAFEIIRDDYVSAVETKFLTDAAIAAVRQRSESREGDWAKCIEVAASSALPKKFPAALKPLMDALNCADFSKSTDHADTMVDVALEAMVSKLDDRSEWLGPDDLTATPATFGSVGLSLIKQSDKFTVVRTGARTPGRLAGIEEGDVLLAIDGVTVASLTLDQIIERCRGIIGSQVTLTVKRGDSPSRDIIIKREKISSDAEIEIERVGNVLIVHFTSFPLGARDTFQKLMISQLSGVRGIILDLRNNAGGLLDETLLIADDFLDKAPIVTSRGRTASDIEKWWARKGQIAPGLPVVVLVNANTASGAEIVASALQDNKRAIIMGQRTFGAGTVQTLLAVDAFHALKITTSIEYRPNGAPLTDAVGPDCETDLKKRDLINFALGAISNGGKNCPVSTDGNTLGPLSKTD
jgi:carboxyl-terminal processing protease